MNLYTMGVEDAVNDQRKDPAFTKYSMYNRGYEEGEEIYAKQYALEQMADNEEYKVKL